MRVKKNFKVVLILFISGCVLYFLADIFLWVRYRPGKYDTYIAQLSEMNKKSQKLPDEFYVLYEKIYPGSLSKEIIPDILWIFFNYKNNRFPQLVLSRDFRLTNFDAYMCANAIEEKYSSRQCLEILTTGFDFLNNTVGINEASNRLYAKKVYDLNIDEMLELIIMMQNPAYFNKFKHPDNLAREVNEIKKLRSL